MNPADTAAVTVRLHDEFPGTPVGQVDRVIAGAAATSTAPPPRRCASCWNASRGNAFRWP